MCIAVLDDIRIELVESNDVGEMHVIPSLIPNYIRITNFGLCRVHRSSDKLVSI